MKDSATFVFSRAPHRRAARRVLRKMPPLAGDAIRIHSHPGLRDRRGPVHAGAFLRQRRIACDCTTAEFPRIFAHEVAHFIWLRLGNPRRRAWETLLRSEFRSCAPGELGWSAEWRKDGLLQQNASKTGKGSRPSNAVARRTRRWREYCCEAFCDTAAWMWSGVRRHAEFTLAANLREARRKWFDRHLTGRCLPL